jgi:hypothetical protein
VALMLGGSDNQQRILNELFNEAIPDNARCQVIQYASPKVAGQLDRWADERSRRGGVFAERQAPPGALSRATWRSMSQRGEFLIRHIRVFLCVEIDGQDLRALHEEAGRGARSASRALRRWLHGGRHGWKT